MIFHRAYVRMTSALGGVRWVQSRGRLSVERIISSRTSFPMRLVSRVLTGWYMVGLSRVIAKSDRCVQRICRSCDNEPEYVYPPEHGEFRATLFQLRNQLTTQFRARSDLQPAELTSTPASPWHNLCKPPRSHPLLQLNMASIRKSIKIRERYEVEGDGSSSSVTRHSSKSLRYARNVSFKLFFITFNYNKLCSLSLWVWSHGSSSVAAAVTAIRLQMRWIEFCRM